MDVLELNDFSGGITDFYLDAAPNKLKTLKNCTLEIHDGKALPVQRHGFIKDYGCGQLTTGNQTIQTIFQHGGYNYFAHSSRRIFFTSTISAWAEVLYYDGTYALSSHCTTDTFLTHKSDFFHTYLIAQTAALAPEAYRMFMTTTVTKHCTFPQFMPAKVLSFVSKGGGANSWLYKFVLKHTYTAQNRTTAETAVFVVYGPVSASVSVTAAALNVVWDMPVYAQPSDSLYGEFKMEIYRTATGGSVYYKVGEQVTASGATTFTDSVSDATLILNAKLFLESGEMNNSDASATAKHQCLANGTGYFIAGSDTVYQSKINNPSMVGDTAYTNVGEQLVGIGSTVNGVIALGKTRPYKIDGQVLDTGDGALSAYKIGDIGGCQSAYSIVEALDGVFWAAYEGFYYSDGFKVVYLSNSFRKTWITDVIGNLYNQQGITGTYDPINQRIYWLVSTNSEDYIYVLDLKFGVSENSVFYQWYFDTTNRVRSMTVAPTGVIIRGDSHGYIFLSDSATYTDPRVDTGVAYGSWGTAAIKVELETVGLDMGSRKLRKYSPNMSVTLDRESATYRSAQAYDLCCAITSDNDDGRKVASLKPALVGAITAGVVTQKRHFPAQSLRYYQKRIKLATAYVALYNSTDYITCSINATLKTATLSGYNWPSDILDYFISFETDSFVLDYAITAQSTVTVTYSDGSNTSVTGSAKRWIIRGYPKGQRFKLLGMSLDYEVNGAGQDPYNSVDSKELS